MNLISFEFNKNNSGLIRNSLTFPTFDYSSFQSIFIITLIDVKEKSATKF